MGLGRGLGREDGAGSAHTSDRGSLHHAPLTSQRTPRETQTPASLDSVFDLLPPDSSPCAPTLAWAVASSDPMASLRPFTHCAAPFY